LYRTRRIREKNIIFIQATRQLGRQSGRRERQFFVIQNSNRAAQQDWREGKWFVILKVATGRLFGRHSCRRGTFFFIIFIQQQRNFTGPGG
jgi:hypothetical protein